MIKLQSKEFIESYCRFTEFFELGKIYYTLLSKEEFLPVTIF